MSNRTFKITKHLYIWSYAAKTIAVQEPTADDIVLRDTDESATDNWLYLCPVELDVVIPPDEQIHLMELAGAEQELAKFKENAVKRMAHLEQRVKDLQALTHQEGAA